MFYTCELKLIFFSVRLFVFYTCELKLISMWQALNTQGKWGNEGVDKPRELTPPTDQGDLIKTRLTLKWLDGVCGLISKLYS